MNGQLYVIDTNYVNYAVLFGCGMVNDNKNSHGVWIVSRNRTLSQEYVTKSFDALKRSKIVTKPLAITKQTNCSVSTASTTTKSPVTTTEGNDYDDGFAIF